MGREDEFDHEGRTDTCHTVVPLRLKGKLAVVTGGRQGIGRGIVESFVNEGANVITCGRGGRPLELAPSVTWATLDVSDGEKVNSFVSSVGEIDILVNNAGVQVEKTVPESTDADWDLVVGTNARGVFNLCRAFIPRMRESGTISTLDRFPGWFPIPRWRCIMPRRHLCMASRGQLRLIMVPGSAAMRSVPAGSRQECWRRVSLFPATAAPHVLTQLSDMRLDGLELRPTSLRWRSCSPLTSPHSSLVSVSPSMEDLPLPHQYGPVCFEFRHLAGFSDMAHNQPVLMSCLVTAERLNPRRVTAWRVSHFRLQSNQSVHSYRTGGTLADSSIVVAVTF